MDAPTLSMRAQGPWACFTQPAFKVERVSYQVPTPSAVRGIYEAILWRPAIRWVIKRITVLKPIRWFEFRTNELKQGMAAPSKTMLAEGGELKPFFASDHRTQRSTLCLRDVDYIFDATFELTDKAGPTDTVEKFVSMFTRRMEIGQYFHAPYFGIREFVAECTPAPDPRPTPVLDSADLGLMIHDIDYTTKPKRARLILSAR